MSTGQKAAILRWLQDGGTLTHLEAERMFGCARLAARVGEIRAEYGADAVLSTTERRNGKHWTRYSWNRPQLSLWDAA